MLTAALGRSDSSSERSAPAKANRASVRFASSGNHSEIRERVPISQRKWGKKRVAMTIPPAHLPTLHRGDLLRTTGEVQLSTTCIDFNSVRCIGRRYALSPRVDARIVIAARRGATGGDEVMAIAQTDSLRCHQPLPNRNHHCVLVFPPTTTRISHPNRLPCRPDACRLNLVVEADHPRARDGQVVLVGADRPDGTVRQDKGRLSAMVLRGRVQSKRLRTAKRQSRSIPIAPSGKTGRRVIYSQRINKLHEGDVIEASVRHLITISSLRYATFIGTDVVLARSPGAVSSAGLPRKVATGNGDLTEQNGFNCTHGPSAYRDPCRTRKAGAVQIKRDAEQQGRPVPLWVNVVTAGLPKGTTAKPRDRMRVLPRGELVVRRYRAG
jgi:ribosomal protein L39E